MNTYLIKGNFELLTPNVERLDDIQKEIVQSAECIKNISTYPDGTILEITQFADRTIIKSNREIVENGDGRFTLR